MDSQTTVGDLPTTRAEYKPARPPSGAFQGSSQRPSATSGRPSTCRRRLWGISKILEFTNMRVRGNLLNRRAIGSSCRIVVWSRLRTPGDRRAFPSGRRGPGSSRFAIRLAMGKTGSRWLEMASIAGNNGIGLH